MHIMVIWHVFSVSEVNEVIWWLEGICLHSARWDFFDILDYFFHCAKLFCHPNMLYYLTMECNPWSFTWMVKQNTLRTFKYVSFLHGPIICTLCTSLFTTYTPEWFWTDIFGWSTHSSPPGNVLQNQISRGLGGEKISNIAHIIVSPENLICTVICLSYILWKHMRLVKNNFKKLQTYD